MELQTFEQAILKLAFETNARITTASVAYYLGIPSREATRLLNSLLEEGVLELDSDAAGNLFYRVPNKPLDSDGDDLRDLRDAKLPPPLPRQTAPLPTAYLTATIDESEGEAYAPAPPDMGAARPRDHVRSPEAAPLRSEAFGRPWGQSRDKARDSWGGMQDYYGAPDGQDGTSGTAVARPSFKPAWPTVSTRTASPDASLDSCGSSKVVVSTKVRCEPRPLPAAKPVIVSCSDTALEPRQEQGWFGTNSNSSTALVPAGETALQREYYIEQPEHQPGMALLLSLILCGTGQIYNGEVSKGIMMMVLCFLLWFVLLGWVVHIWSIVDAVVVAERLNRRNA